MGEFISLYYQSIPKSLIVSLASALLALILMLIAVSRQSSFYAMFASIIILVGLGGWSFIGVPSLSLIMTQGITFSKISLLQIFSIIALPLNIIWFGKLTFFAGQCRARQEHNK